MVRPGIAWPGPVPTAGAAGYVGTAAAGHATATVVRGKAMTAGDIYTMAGDGTAGFSGDSGPR
jgi:hypothetical protein